MPPEQGKDEVKSALTDMAFSHLVLSPVVSKLCLVSHHSDLFGITIANTAKDINPVERTVGKLREGMGHWMDGPDLSGT